MGVVIDFLGGLMIGLDWIALVEGDLGGGMGDRLYCTYRWKIWVMDDKIGTIQGMRDMSMSMSWLLWTYCTVL